MWKGINVLNSHFELLKSIIFSEKCLTSFTFSKNAAIDHWIVDSSGCLLVHLGRVVMGASVAFKYWIMYSLKPNRMEIKYDPICLQACRSSRGELALRTKTRVCHPIMASSPLDWCATWPLIELDERWLVVYDNSYHWRILRHCSADRISYSDVDGNSIRLRRWLKWLGHSARREEGELVINSRKE